MLTTSLSNQVPAATHCSIDTNTNQVAIMSDSENDSDNSKQAAPAPAWQQQQAAASNKAPEAPNMSTTPPPSQQQDDTTQLERAKRFLQDDAVRDASREKKAEFLASKGIAQADIQNLLDGEEAATDQLQQQQPQQQATSIVPSSSSPLAPAAQAQEEPAYDNTQQDTNNKPDHHHHHHPPIVTYPEFLTKPAKPPPLITAAGLANALGAVAGLSATVYGATKYLVSPMVASLTEARVDFHDNAHKHLAHLVDKLEHAVSEIPATYHHHHHTNNNKSAAGGGGDARGDKDDDASSYDDPTELFHRDVGVQTSPPASPAAAAQQQFPYNNSSDSPPSQQNLTPAETTQYQADRLARISLAARTLAADTVAQADDWAATKAVLDALGGDLHALTYPPESFGMGSSYMYGTARNEPDDEIKKAKTNIRSVKGVLLSTRSFPATTR